MEILLDRAEQIYTNGSEVTGNVILTSYEPVNCEQIIVSLKGEGRVFFSAVSGKAKRIYPQYSGHHHGEVYCAKSKKLHPHLVDSIVPAGEHRFPFQFKITGSRLPTSFKGPLGYIRYYVGAKLVQCSSKEDIVASVEIPFVETVDINSEYLLKPVCEEKKTAFYKLISDSSTITLRVQLDRSGYCTGEGLTIQADVQNDCCSDVVLKAKLIQKGQFSDGHHQSNYPSKVLAAVIGPQVAPGEHFQWNSDSLIVPPTEPTIKTCSYITVHYVLKVSAVLSPVRRCAVEIPVTIGNVPLARY